MNSEFGYLFEEAARNTGSEVTHHGFDSALVEIKKDNLTAFLDEIHAQLVQSESVQSQ